MQLKQGQLTTAQIDGQLKQAPGVQADLLVENGARPDVDAGRHRPRTPTQVLFTVSLFNWPSTEWRSAEAWAGRVGRSRLASNRKSTVLPRRPARPAPRWSADAG